MNEQKKEAPELLIVPLALMNDIMAYLGTKPYTEVTPYINAIQEQAKLAQPKAEGSDTPEIAPEVQEKPE